MAVSSGTQLGSYQVLGHLGSGGMGEVYRAKDTMLGREVVLKVLPEAFAHDTRLDRIIAVNVLPDHFHSHIFTSQASFVGLQFLPSLVTGQTAAMTIAAGKRLRLSEALSSIGAGRLGGGR